MCSWVKKRITDFRFFTVFIYTIEWQSALCAAGRQTSSHEANIHWGSLWAAGGKQALRRLLEQKLCVGSVGRWRNQKYSLGILCRIQHENGFGVHEGLGCLSFRGRLRSWLFDVCLFMCLIASGLWMVMNGTLQGFKFGWFLKMVKTYKM